MKEPWEWDESDILSLIENRASESLTLEFKACDALTNKEWKSELLKDISAFANSAGGTVIYGIRENKKTHEADSIDVGYDPGEHKKEKLEQVIDSNIQRRIEGVRYNAIRLNKTRPGRVLFVICIPQSSRSPHMANHRYYKRLEFEAKAMEEYEVREKYGRVTFPSKDVVEAWRDDAINPLISTLARAAGVLRSEQWTWTHIYSKFGGLESIGDQREVSANAEDFIMRYPEVGVLLANYDEALVAVNAKGQTLFDKLSSSSFIRETFADVTSEESLERIAAKSQNKIHGNVKELYAELFGRDRDPEHRINYIAESAINQRMEGNVEPMLLFWQVYGHRFRDLILFPPLDEFRRAVEKARQEMLEIGIETISTLKDIRTKLSEKHNVAVQASRGNPELDYGAPFRGRRFS
ncbi:MAG: hypothetical protein QOE77_2496 [Blastocatellia bacterium]|nr:hypothetical protein [Blastocatellia bacterium]